jgi:hypothetical protein
MKFEQTHGMSFSTEYNIWRGMLDRCYNEKDSAYHRYGGRGITVCDEWRNSFETFYADMGNRPSDYHTIDREQNDEGYSKDNCRWATYREQANNRSNNVHYEHNGKNKTLPEWCREFGLDIVIVKNRIRIGWSFDESVELRPRTKTCRLYELNGLSKTLPDWCKDLGLNYRTMLSRIQNGMPFEKAAISFIAARAIIHDGTSKSLKNWCEVLDMDLRSTCMHIVTGITFEDLIRK